MLALTMNCEVTADHVVTIKLPESIQPGPCQITMLVNGYEPTTALYAQEQTSVDPDEFATQRLAALEAARARFGNLVLSSKELAARKQEEIALEECKFAQ